MENLVHSGLGAILPDVVRAALPANTDGTARRGYFAGIDGTRLTYHVLHPRAVGVADAPLVGEAYRLWREVWSETYLELDGRGDIASDEFTRQDEIGAVFYGYECIALSCARWIDLGSPMHADDSYFRIWSDEARTLACRHGSKLCVGTHASVSRAWRLRRLPLAAIVTAMTLDRSKASGADALVATMRDDRGMHSLVGRLGAERIGNEQLHGVPVTLVAFYQHAARQPLPTEVEQLVQRFHSSVKGTHQ